MTQAQAARTSLPEVRMLVEGKNREHQERWEIARWMSWRALLLSPDIKAAHKPSSARAWFAFPWEEPEKEMTPEDCHISAETEQALNELVKDYYKRRAASELS